MILNLDGRSLYYEIHGDGMPLLLVHGFPLSGELWRPLVSQLARDYRLIVPDLRGHGRSQASATVTMAEFADDLVALLEAIGESRSVVLVGMSMGGYVSFEFYRRYRERVRALVLTNTKAEADGAEAAAARRTAAERTRREGSGVVAESMMPRLFGPRAPEALQAQWREIMVATPPEGVAAALEALAARPDSIATLESATCPVLIVAGEHDEITPPDDARRMQQAAPGSRLEVLPGAGHMSVVECPERFVEILNPFLEALPREA